jgi:hypothetical protein
MEAEPNAPKESGTSEAGKQGRTKPEPFKPTSEISNGDGQMIAYDLLEESAREIGIPATAAKYQVNEHALRSRARDHKWKKIPDGRTLAKRNKGTGSELATTEGDFSSRVAPFRERVFKKMDESLGKFRAKAPKSFKEFDSASKIAERMMGIGDEGAKIGVLVHINEAIDEHGENMQPIEATEVDAIVSPCIPVSRLPDSVQQGNKALPEPAASYTDHTPPKESVTLNPDDVSDRRFVLPGIIKDHTHPA